MCCFSRPVAHVGATNIFARAAEDGGQLLAYGMNVRIAEPLAMILPLPVPKGSADDAVRFISLAGFADFFVKLRAAFPAIYAEPQAKSRLARSFRPERPKLVVHDVGSYEASFVPRVSDFERLDDRFRLPPAALANLGQYADWGFAVFQLKPEKTFFGRVRMQTVHPMAFEFPRRDPSALYFPTVHVHDGEVHPRASFDHTLYAQVDEVTGQTLGFEWTRSNVALGQTVDAAKAMQLIAPDQVGFALPLKGDLPNRDHFLRTPDVRSESLVVSGECFLIRVRGTMAHAIDEELSAERKAWRETAMRDLDRVSRALREGVTALVEQNRTTWNLAPHPAPIPAFWPYHYGPSGPTGSPCLISFHPFNDRVEPQEVILSFASCPSNELQSAIERDLRALLDRALS